MNICYEYKYISPSTSHSKKSNLHPINRAPRLIALAFLGVMAVIAASGCSQIESSIAAQNYADARETNANAAKIEGENQRYNNETNDQEALNKATLDTRIAEANNREQATTRGLVAFGAILILGGGGYGYFRAQQMRAEAQAAAHEAEAPKAVVTDTGRALALYIPTTGQSVVFAPEGTVVINPVTGNVKRLAKLNEQQLQLMIAGTLANERAAILNNRQGLTSGTQAIDVINVSPQRINVKDRLKVDDLSKLSEHEQRALEQYIANNMPAYAEEQGTSSSS